MSITLRPIRAEELEAWFASFATAFYIWPSDPAAKAESRRESIELDRAIGAFDGDTIVGTFRSFATQLTLPGGARIDANAVSAVSVRPTHRRRGTLTRMAHDDIRRASERGDAVCILIASEWPIYGRFGYGPATWQATWTIRSRVTRALLEPVGSIDIVRVAAAREILPELYDRCAANQPGEIARLQRRWDVDLGVIEVPGRPKWSGQVVIHRDGEGRPDGFARFHGEENWIDMAAEHVMLLDELHATNLEAELDLWRHLLQMDLTATIKAEVRRTAEPLKWVLSNPRAAQVAGVTDFLWLRILDVPRVLGDRRYDHDGEVVLEVTDQLDGAAGPAAGRYRLVVTGGAATCERTDADADLTIDVRALSAASLGGTRLTDASRALPFAEHRPGAMRKAEGLLLTADPPWCSTWF
jgi:predicted acetyltransferase